MTEQVALDLADGKEPEAFRTIGEVAQAFGLRQHVLRYWEEQFPMLKPLKRAGGRRYYRPEDVRLVSEINRLLYKEGFTIRGARQALKSLNGESSRPSSASPATIPAEAAPERPGEELERDEPAHIGDEAGRKLRQLREGLAAALAKA